jgi:CRISPR-associated protein Cmr3
MCNYLITLRPIDPYFFGGQTTFGDGRNANYLVKSEKLPQQTTLIGMLRKEILIQSNLFQVDNKYSYEIKSAIKEKIGPSPFSIDGENDFGVLKAVSPIFITDGINHYIPVPLDLGIEYSKHSGVYGASDIAQDRQFFPFLSPYSAKTGLARGFLSDQGTGPFLDEQIFHAVEKVGIKKGEYGETQEKAYYKQTSYLLLGNFRMAAIIDCEYSLGNALVEMGGERSTFQMMVEETNKGFLDIFDKIRSRNNRLLLYSDSFAPPDIYDECDFAITEIVNLRYFNNMLKGHDKSSLFSLFKRGSVFFGDPEKIENKLNKPGLRKMGFNIFKR